MAQRCCASCRFLKRIKPGDKQLPRCLAPVPLWIAARFPWIDRIADPETFGVECLSWMARSDRKKG